MDEFEAMLRPDPAKVGPVDSEHALPIVMAAGRRKRAGRRAGAAGLVAVGAAAAVLLLPLDVPGLTVQDAVGGGHVATDPTTGSRVASHEEEPEPTPGSGQVSAVEPRPTAMPSSPPSTPDATETATQPWVPLTLEVTTDRDRYAQGDPVTIEVQACNTTQDPHEEWFADPNWRFRLQVITADDRNIAFGEHPRVEEESSEVWQPAECRSFAIVWDQTEGPFEEQGGQQAWEGEHRIELSWWGVAPPPPGMDPGLYDPLGRESVWSRPFLIDPAPDDDPSLPL